MPKNKTHSGASKRFKVTGPGRSAACRRAGSPALRSRRRPPPASRKKHRRNAGMVELAKADVKRVKKLLGR